MGDAELDLLVLGREANARYVSGAQRLWLAGTRPFAPGCVVIQATGAVHLLSVTADGVPATVPPDRLYPISWNPLNLVGAVAAAAAGVSVRRIGVDGMSPLFARLLASVFPDAMLCDGEALLRMVRRVKSSDDIAGLRAAVGVAEEAFAAVVQASASERNVASLGGVFAERAAQLGATTPALEAMVGRDGVDWSVRAGVIHDGWEGSVLRTWPGGGAARAVVASGVDACRPGVAVAAIEALGADVDGVGLGHEEVRSHDVLQSGMVVTVQATVEGAVHGATVWVSESGPQVLTGAG